MDWHGDERLLSVSADRNGYVWTCTKGAEWRPTLVLLRLRRAATCVKWSHDGRKFAVGGSEGVVSVGHYEVENDWWVCKHLKNIDGSAILSLAWHPNGRLLSVSTLAGKVHILTTSLKAVDGQSSPQLNWIPEPLALSTFDQSTHSFNFGCWIHGMEFSPDGNSLVMAGHDANVYIHDLEKDRQISLTSPSGLSVRRVLHVSESAIVFTGFGASSPVLIAKDSSDSWKIEGSLENLAITHTSSKIAEKPAASKAFGGALAKFKALDSQGVSTFAKNDSKQAESATSSIHKGGISEMRMIKGNLTTTGLDGQLVIWSLGCIANRIGLDAVVAGRR